MGLGTGRRRADPIEVKRRDEAPEQFLWRGRLYIVRAVLDHWVEAGGWWSAPELTGEDPPEGATNTPAAGGLPDDREREFWRVEAQAGAQTGAQAGPGVFDLCFDWSSGQWRLVGVQD